MKDYIVAANMELSQELSVFMNPPLQGRKESEDDLANIVK